jgi:leader peptidase (prepilin peptidase)/N-methyltransferase
MAACARGRQPSAGKGSSDEQLGHRGRSRAPGVLAGVPARGVIQRLAGPPAAAQARRRWPGIAPAMGLLWFAVTLRLASQGLGWAVPAYLALAFVCPVLAVIDAATRLLPNRITYPAFPVVAGLLVAASLGLGELGRLGRGLLAAASVGGLFLPLALLSPHGMGWAMSSWPRPWAWRSPGGRGGRWRWGWWPASCSAA